MSAHMQFDDADGDEHVPLHGRQSDRLRGALLSIFSRCVVVRESRFSKHHESSSLRVYESTTLPT